MSKVIFKMSFKHPNLKDTKAKNTAHLNYIATRPGVDKAVTESDLKRELSKGIEHDESDDRTYLKYINERPRSHGLFGADGVEDLESVRDEIHNCESYVWRSIISIREEDAKELGYLSKDKWQDFIRKKMPDLAAEMGIGVTNLRWAAAIHMEKGHPHAHVIFWEKEPVRTIGITSSKVLDKMRKLLTDEVFEDERFQLTNEKNAMRDLIRDLANNNVGEATKILKEIRSQGLELRSLNPEMNQEGVSPKLYNEEETELAEKIKNLSLMMPGKGRAMLKFMPQDVKDEVRAIADYILSKPDFAASLERNLRAAEELTKMYTGKEEAIQKARDKAFNDIRDRICQIILRGAVESLRDNYFTVNEKSAANFISFMHNLDKKINQIPERMQVLNQMSIAMLRAGIEDKKIHKILSDFSSRESLGFTQQDILRVINDLKESGAESNEINSFSSSKRIDFVLSSLKLAGFSEEESFSIIKDAIHQDAIKMNEHFNKLEEQGFLESNDNGYSLTNNGIRELLSAKMLDSQQKSILSVLESGDKSFSELIDNKEVFGSMINKDPEEFKISRYDIKVREEFGDFNRITLNELEGKIYRKYNEDEIEKAEREFDIIRDRIEKLCKNGYVKFDKENGSFSFTQEGINALDSLTDKMEFTRYDANVTLGYIDKVEDGILRSNELRNIIYQETVNQKANIYLERFTDIIDSGNSKEYISVDDEGKITATKQGKDLSFEIGKINKYFKDGIALKELDKEALNIIREQVNKGNVIQMKDGSFIIDPIKQDIRNLLYQVYKEGGTIQKEDLKNILDKNIPNRDAEKQFNYIIKRLENLKVQGYIEGAAGEYKLTYVGSEKRQDLLSHERIFLRKELEYLRKLGFIEKNEGCYSITGKYKSYMEDVAKAKKDGVSRISKVFSSEDVKLLEKSYGHLNPDKIERINQRLAAGKYLNDDFKQLPSNYDKIREFCHVDDIVYKTLNKLTVSLLVSGSSLEEARGILYSWNEKSMSNFEIEELDKIIYEAHKIVENDRAFGKLTVVSKKEWEEIFKNLNVDPPEWIYRGQNWKEYNAGIGMCSLVNDIWKGVWGTLERQRMQSEAQAEMLKKNAIKQQATENKSARVEQARKAKDKSAIHQDEYFD